MPTAVASSFARCALAGAVLGIGIALLLEALAIFGGDEAGEAAVIYAHLLSMPVSLIGDALDWGHYASEWLAFIGVAPPINGLLLGGLVGIVALRTRRDWRLRHAFAAVGAVWVALFSVVMLAA